MSPHTSSPSKKQYRVAGSQAFSLPPAELSENAIKRGQRRERVFLYLPLSVVMTHSVDLGGKYKEPFKTEERMI